MHQLLKRTLLCLLLLATKPAAAQASSGSVTFINPGGNQGFWGNVSAVMQAASRQLDIELEVLNSNRNRILMLEHANDIVSRAELPDIVIIVNELQQGSQLLEILGHADIPVYFLLNTLTDNQIDEITKEMNSTSPVIGSIIPENYRAGYEMLMRLAQESRAKNPEKKIAVLAILGDQLTPAALEREAGMRQAIKELDNVELGRAFSVLWDPAVASKRVSTALSIIEFDAIWAANDALALASKKAVDENCTDTVCNNIPVVGLNWSPEGVKAVKNGELVSSHGGHFTAGGYAIAAIHRYLRGQTIAKKVTLLMESIDSKNAGQLHKLIEPQSWDHINFINLANSLNDAQTKFDPISLLNSE